MSYPDLPNNRLIVNDIDLTETYGLILMDGYTLEPPEPKTYTVDIPGGNGVIDLTDALSGDTVYSNRKQEFELCAIAVDSFEELKTKISNLLHGRAFDYKITMDPEYTYHGRFTVSSYTHSVYSIGTVGTIKLTVDADPYKHKKNITQVYNSLPGMIAYPISGRKKVQPKFEFSDDTIVIFDNVRNAIPKGTYTLEDVWFTEGQNEIFFMSGNAKSHTSHKELKQYTFSDIRTMKPIYMWYTGGTKYLVETITLKPNGSEISGVVTFTATDALGNTFSSSIDLGDFVMRTIGDTCDYLEIDGDTARFVRWISDDVTQSDDPNNIGDEIITDETGKFRIDISPTVFAFDFAQLFSNDAEITGLSHDTTGKVTYTVGSMNTERTYIDATHGTYKEGGDHAMTHKEMSVYRNSQLRKIDTETNNVYEVKEEAVYLDYEWSDL